jgi:hypothetical protein
MTRGLPAAIRSSSRRCSRCGERREREHVAASARVRGAGLCDARDDESCLPGADAWQLRGHGVARGEHAPRHAECGRRIRCIGDHVARDRRKIITRDREAHGAAGRDRERCEQAAVRCRSDADHVERNAELLRGGERGRVVGDQAVGDEHDRRAIGSAIGEHAGQIEHRVRFAPVVGEVALQIRGCAQLAGRESGAISCVERTQQRADERTLDGVAIAARGRRAIEDEPAAGRRVRCRHRSGDQRGGKAIGFDPAFCRHLRVPAHDQIVVARRIGDEVAFCRVVVIERVGRTGHGVDRGRELDRDLRGAARTGRRVRRHPRGIGRALGIGIATTARRRSTARGARCVARRDDQRQRELPRPVGIARGRVVAQCHDDGATARNRRHRLREHVGALLLEQARAQTVRDRFFVARLRFLAALDPRANRARAEVDLHRTDRGVGRQRKDERRLGRFVGRVLECLHDRGLDDRTADRDRDLTVEQRQRCVARRGRVHPRHARQTAGGRGWH